MPLYLLPHLPRGAEDFNASRATAVLKPVLRRDGMQVKRVPAHVLPTAMRDLASDEALCVKNATRMSEDTLRCLRWAVHKRHSDDLNCVRRQLLCDLNRGDESRVRRKRTSRRHKG
jgi:hypothetical protein